jgi:ATP-dependent Clp protease adaptor protein ClpS
MAMAEKPRPGGDTAVVVPKPQQERETRRPPLYKVLFHNDDYTTQEFVEQVLIVVFNHDPETAHRIMLHVHMHGVGVAGIYPFEIAETKMRKTTELAREAEYPLLVTVEPE